MVKSKLVVEVNTVEQGILPQPCATELCQVAEVRTGEQESVTEDGGAKIGNIAELCFGKIGLVTESGISKICRSLKFRPPENCAVA